MVLFAGRILYFFQTLYAATVAFMCARQAVIKEIHLCCLATEGKAEAADEEG